MAPTPTAAPPRRPRRLIAAAVLASLASIGSTATARAADTVRYAALGDSYSAGVGTRDSQNDCYQSPKGYAPLAAATRGWSLDYLACSGATTATTGQQTAQLSASTTLVSLTVGGNDAGFSTVMTQCALPGWLGDCSSAVASANSVVTTQLQARLTALYARIHAASPSATVVQLGYPHLFNGRDCSWLTFFSAGEMEQMNAVTDTMATLEARAASAAGVRFVDSRAAFAGHEVCSSAPWINDLTVPTTESFHPNAAGQVGYENLLLTTVDAGGSLRRTAGVSPIRVGPNASAAVPHSATTATDAQVLAAARQMPRLSASLYLARGRRAGVGAQTLRRLDADLHSGNATRARRAFSALHALDAHR